MEEVETVKELDCVTAVNDRCSKEMVQDMSMDVLHCSLEVDDGIHKCVSQEMPRQRACGRGRY